MFDIEYKGGNSLVITTKKDTLAIDPKRSIVGLTDLNINNAIEIATETRFAVNNDSAKLIIDGPGEYGISDFDINGIAAQRHLDSEDKGNNSTIYRIEVGDVRIGLVGNIYEKLSEDQLESLGIIDILVIPVGGNGYTLDATGATGLIGKIGPKVVIPVHYEDKGLKYEVPQDSLSVFIKELGAPVETTAKYKVKGTVSMPVALTVVEVTRS